MSALTAYKIYLFRIACFKPVDDIDSAEQKMAERFDWEVTFSFAFLAFTLFFTGLSLLL